MHIDEKRTVVAPGGGDPVKENEALSRWHRTLRDLNCVMVTQVDNGLRTHALMLSAFHCMQILP